MRASASRHIVVVDAAAPKTCSRSPQRCPTPSMQSAPSTTAATRSANTAPGEYIHRPRYVSANTAVTCAESPVTSASSRSILKRLGVAWRLAQQLNLRFGPVEAHGPVYPDRLVP